MGRGRARAGAVAVVAALVVALAGCGAQSHPNDQRPSPATRLSVTITNDGVVVTPTKIAFGPEKSQQLPQNQNQPQPPIKGDDGPLAVVFVAANQTTKETHLELRGPRDDSSNPIPPQSPGSFQTELPAGTYVLAAAGMPSAGIAKFSVGDYRASSQNDVLLP